MFGAKCIPTFSVRNSSNVHARELVFAPNNAQGQCLFQCIFRIVFLCLRLPGVPIASAFAATDDLNRHQHYTTMCAIDLTQHGGQVQDARVT